MTPIVQSVRVPPSLRARRREKKKQNVTGGKRLLIHWRTPPYPLRGCRKHWAFFNRLFFSLGCVCVCVCVSLRLCAWEHFICLKCQTNY